MPSIKKLFIRVSKTMSSTYIFDAINELDICKVNEVYIVPTKHSPYNVAYAYVDYWYKGSKDIRDTLHKGGAMYIPNCYGRDLEAYEFINPRPNKQPDEFGRDVPRTFIAKIINPLVNPAFNDKDADTEKSSEYSLPTKEENEKAAAEFIANHNPYIY
jgi:hypothetical protein